MDYYTFQSVLRNLDKTDPRRQELIRQYPGYVDHIRVMSMKKLMEIRARKKEPA